MRFLLVENGVPIDAHYEFESTSIVVHSRGGKKGIGGKNTEYRKGLGLLLERLRSCDALIANVHIDTNKLTGLPTEQKVVAADKDLQQPINVLLEILAKRMKVVGQNEGAKGGNSTRRLRINITGQVPSLEKLQGRPVNLSHEMLGLVRSDHLYSAVTRLLNQESHPFGNSVGYDVLIDDFGNRLPPKAVFGFAAGEALGFDVGPYHFKGGQGSPCFQALEKAGYVIVPKDGAVPTAIKKVNPDQEWTEGDAQERNHLGKERARGVAKAKKDEFRRLYGKLFCEVCKSDFSKLAEGEREAAFEVHHRAVSIAQMAAGHRTKLGDLQCLCANCHRQTHWRIRAEQNKSKS
ncbi:HNH endonuclease [Polaromonas sp.]|uniref:HNH endonuclease n=1 Tax=Polaromonas sp. TaxID=1869339 RepID=UPI0017EBFDA5|nr:HNH endonuclease [Polaromonas sp.]NML85777.1 hypothetical protein [Polaromonas sp.]